MFKTIHEKSNIQTANILKTEIELNLERRNFRFYNFVKAGNIVFNTFDVIFSLKVARSFLSKELNQV